MLNGQEILSAPLKCGLSNHSGNNVSQPDKLSTTPLFYLNYGWTIANMNFFQFPHNYLAIRRHIQDCPFWIGSKFTDISLAHHDFSLTIYYHYRPQGKVMFSQASVILSTVGLMATQSLLILVTTRSVRILLECFHVYFIVMQRFYVRIGKRQTICCRTCTLCFETLSMKSFQIS